jgi:outer membrane protein
MKKLLKSLLVLTAFGSIALFAQAQTAPKILFVDIAKLYEGHYKTKAGMAALQAAGQKAQTQIDGMSKERDTLIEQWKELQDQSKNNPAATEEAKAKAAAQAQDKYEEIRVKTADMNKFNETASRELQQRHADLVATVTGEIAKIAADVAKRDGATILMDKSGPSNNGLPVILYSDPSADITDEVAAEIAKTRPVAAPETPAASQAPAAAPASVPAVDQPPKS